MPLPAVTFRLIETVLFVTVLSGLACEKQPVDPGTNEPIHWTNFSLSNQSGDTLRMSFHSTTNIGLDGGTLFQKTAHTVCNIDDMRPDGAHTRFLILSFPGSMTGLYSFDGSSTSTMLELSVPDTPLVFFPRAGLQCSTRYSGI